MGVLIIGANLVAKGVLGRMGQIHPIFHMHIGESAKFSKFGGSLKPKLD